MSRLRARFHPVYRFAAFLALLAMLVPSGIGLVHHPAPVMAMAATMPADCGMAMPAAADNGHAPQPAPAQKAPACPICQGMHLLGGGFILPPPVLPLLLATIIAAFIPTRRAFLTRLLIAPQARPRAPPLLFV